MASKCGASLSFVALTAVFGLVVPLAGASISQERCLEGSFQNVSDGAELNVSAWKNTTCPATSQFCIHIFGFEANTTSSDATGGALSGNSTCHNPSDPLMASFCEVEGEFGLTTSGPGTETFYYCCSGFNCFSNVSLSDIIDCAENQPLVQSFSVFENNNVQGASNILSVQFSFNRELSPGLPISINATGGSVLSPASGNVTITQAGNETLLPQAVWSNNKGIQHENISLVVTTRRKVEAYETIAFDFELTNNNKTQPKLNFTIESPVVLSGCELRNTTHFAAALGVNYVEPACSLPDYFGANCDRRCYGVVVGDKCKCTSDLTFGPDCNKTAQVNTAKSIAPVSIAKGAKVALTRADGKPMINIPAGALPGNIVLEIKSLEFTDFEMPSSQTEFSAAGPISIFTPHGVKFSQAVEIWLDISASASAGNELKPAVFDPDLGVWEILIGEVVDGRMKGFTTHFSSFSTLSVPAATTTPAPATTTPAPTDCSKVTSKPTISYSPGTAFCKSNLGNTAYGSYACGVKLEIAGGSGSGSFALLDDAEFPSDTACLKVSSDTKDKASLIKAPSYASGYPMRFRQVPKESFASKVMNVTLPTGLMLDVTSPEITGITSRRAVTSCPVNQGYRLGKVGWTYNEVCACAKTCGPTASCIISESGQYLAMLVPDSYCEATLAPDPPYCHWWFCKTGWIIGGTVLGLVAIAALAVLLFFCLRRRPEPQALAEVHSATQLKREPLNAHVWELRDGQGGGIEVDVDLALADEGAGLGAGARGDRGIVAYAMPSSIVAVGGTYSAPSAGATVQAASTVAPAQSRAERPNFGTAELGFGLAQGAPQPPPRMSVMPPPPAQSRNPFALHSQPPGQIQEQLPTFPRSMQPQEVPYGTSSYQPMQAQAYSSLPLQVGQIAPDQEFGEA